MPNKDLPVPSEEFTLSVEQCYQDIAAIMHQARNRIAHHINETMVEAYWQIGRRIVEVEQKGEVRAHYGDQLLVSLSAKLTQHLEKGFSTTLLKRLRQFYLAYPKGASAQHLLEDEADETQKGAALRHLSSQWMLSWTHYRLLMTLENPLIRHFYETEAAQNQWSTRELERQMNTFLFERLAKSKDKAGLMALVKNGQEIRTPEDTLKDPYVFEFLKFPSHQLVKESALEEALLQDLKSFFLELGKGFSFVARQKRLTIDGSPLYVDLVFYHIILKCYVLVDLKMDTLTHGDLGQMQVYVNYFDKECKLADDNPTIGLILCPHSNENLVQYFMGDTPKPIYSREYRLHLPTEQELSQELKRELFHIQQQLKDEKEENKQ